MPEETSIDLTALVAPIAADQPTGTDLRTNQKQAKLYHEIRDLRSQARDAERQLEYGDVPQRRPSQIWRSAQSVIVDALSNHTKDLELVAYLIESLTRLESFTGLRTGLQVVLAFITQYWDELHPVAVDDPYNRIGFINGLNGTTHSGTLVGPILACPITNSRVDGTQYSASDYRVAEGKADTKAATEMLDAIRESAAETPATFLAEQRAALRDCLSSLDELARVIDQVLGPDALHSSRLRDAVESCQQTITYLAGPEPSSEPESAAETTLEDESDGTDMPNDEHTELSALDFAGGPIESRQQAMQLLAHVGRYFRNEEPHSPISYAIDQIIDWGKTPLPELMNLLIPDPNARLMFFTLVGIPADQDAA